MFPQGRIGQLLHDGAADGFVRVPETGGQVLDSLSQVCRHQAGVHQEAGAFPHLDVHVAADLLGDKETEDSLLSSSSRQLQLEEATSQSGLKYQEITFLIWGYLNLSYLETSDDTRTLVQFGRQTPLLSHCGC